MTSQELEISDPDYFSKAFEKARRQGDYLKMSEVFEGWLILMKILFPDPDDFAQHWRECTNFPRGRILDWVLSPFSNRYERDGLANLRTYKSSWSRQYPHLGSQVQIGYDQMLALYSNVFTVELTGEMCPGPRFPRLPLISELNPPILDRK